MSTGNRSHRRLIQNRAIEAARAIRVRGWKGAEVVLVKIPKFPLRSSTRPLWVKQIHGEPFDLKIGQLNRDVENYPVWLGSDGNLYEVALRVDNSLNASTPLVKAVLSEWPARGLAKLYQPVYEALNAIVAPQFK